MKGKIVISRAEIESCVMDIYGYKAKLVDIGMDGANRVATFEFEIESKHEKSV